MFYIVSFGDALYRSLDAVDRPQEEHTIHIGLINKCTLNVINHDMMERITTGNIWLVVKSLQRQDWGLNLDRDSYRPTTHRLISQNMLVFKHN